ncbi:TonB-dependent receptor [Paraglaciecola sp. L3A3]|uniref:TonB-dependent receptor n=1 Tax=Paraglaciecola sp. L3A3 TaxID=2686358 RepID=UPI00131C212D|nr:TonB-dependent receptor [Paraglaciecola sp. L3A3]
MKQLPRKKQLVIACAQAMILMFAQSGYAQEETSNTGVTAEKAQESLTAVERRAKQKKLEDNIEQIEVIGYAGSVQKALDTKRYASGVVDTLIAEDMGKMADANVAEAMQRMTGISIDRDGGEGTTISIRGLGPSMNQVSMNGQTMSGVGSYDPAEPDAVNSGVSFDTMSADMLSRIEVIKTPQASTVEGSLGGRVNLRSRQPLDSKRTRFTAGVKESYNELSENINPSFKMGYVGQFFDNKFGVGFGATSEITRGRTDSVNSTGWRPKDVTHNYNGWAYMQEGLTQDPNSADINTPDPSKPLYGYDQANGLLYDGNETLVEDVDFNSLRNSTQTVYMPDQFQYSYTETTKKRKNVSLNLQYKPNDDLSFYANGVYNNLINDSERSLMRLNMSYDPLQTTVTDTNGVAVVTPGIDGQYTGVDFDENGTATRAMDLIGIRQMIMSSSSLETDNLTTNIGFEYEDELWVLSGRLGLSIDKQEQLAYNRLVIRSSSQTMGWDATHDPRLPEYVYGHTTNGGTELALHTGVHPATGVAGLVADLDGSTVGLDPDDIRNNYNYITLNNDHMSVVTSYQNQRELEAINSSAQLDVEYLLDSENFASVEFGFYYTDKSTQTYTDALNVGVTGFNTIFLDSAGASVDFPVDNFLGQTGSGSGLPLQAPVTGWAYANYEIINKSVIDEYNRFYAIPVNNLDGSYPQITNADQMRGTLNPSGSTIFDETYSAIYTQINVDALDGFLIGDFGLRVVNTKIGTDVHNGETATAAECQNGVTYDREACLLNYVHETQTHDYTTVLPSLNLKYLLSEELITRFSIGKAMSRARSHQIDPKRRVATGTQTVYQGNPELKPITSVQLDLTLEWYFDKGAILSAGLFHKDISNFIYKQKKLINDFLIDANGDAVFADYTELNEDGILVTENREVNPYYLQQDVNGESAKITGLEAAYSQNFHFLPDDWSGLGVNTNYTYTDSSAIYEGNDANGVAFKDTFAFEGTSKHTVNASVYWEKYGHSARLSYNYRTDSLSDAITALGDSSYTEAYGQIDFSGRYNISKYLKVGLQVTNLTDESNYKYNMAISDGSGLDGDGYKNRISNYQFNGRTARLTIDATF